MFNYNPNADGPEATDLFDKLYKDITFDKKLYKKLRLFRHDWTKKGVEYAEFLGGNSIGLHPIRFSTRDDNTLLADIYNVDPDSLRNNIIKFPDINKDWSVSTNPILQTLCYTMHRFIVDGKMGNTLDGALRECFYIFSYKVFGSLISHYFKYNTTPAIAKATYEKLSNRYLIKRLGSWNKVLEHRAKTVLPTDGIHSDRLRTYTTLDSIRIINDLQGSIRDTIKYIYVVMQEIINNNLKINSTSLIENTDGGEATSKSLIDRPDRYILRLNETIGSPVNLIDEDIIYLITNFIKSSNTEVVKTTLKTLSNEYDPRSRDAKYTEYIILKTIAYCNTRGISTDYRGNIVEIIGHMKGYWSSGSVKDKEVSFVKDVIDKAVVSSTHHKTKWVIASNTLSVIVYLFVRAIK